MRAGMKNSGWVFGHLADFVPQGLSVVIANQLKTLTSWMHTATVLNIDYLIKLSSVTVCGELEYICEFGIGRLAFGNWTTTGC